MHCLIIIRTVWSQFLQIVRFSGSQWKKSSSIWCIRLYSLKMVFYKIELIIFSTQGWQTNLWADIFVGVIVCFRILSHLHLFWLPFHRIPSYFGTWDAHSMFYYTEETKTNKKKYWEAQTFDHFMSDPHGMPRSVY